MMKQAMNKMITMALFSLSVLGFSNAARAEFNTDQPIEVKYMGRINNQPVFQIRFNNGEAESYYVRVKDESSLLLYAEKLKGTRILRNYQLDISQSDLNDPGFGISIEVTSAKTHKTLIYKVTSIKHTTEDILIAQL